MHLKDLFRNNSFLKDVMNLSSGYAVSQLIVILFSPLLTRLYSPAEFGIFFVFITTSSILSVISTGSYEKAVIVAKNNNDAGEMIKSAIILSAAVSFIALGVSLLLQLTGNNLFKDRFERLTLWIIPIYAFFQGLFRIIQHKYIRENRFSRVSGSFILRSSSASLAQAGLGWASAGSPGLIIGSLLGQVIPVIRESYKNLNLKGLLRKANLQETCRKAREYSDFPLFRMPSELMNEASIQAPVYILKAVFSDAITGLYTFPQKILYQPSKFISQAVADVFFRKAADINSRNEGTGELTLKTYRNLFLTGIVPYLTVMLWGPPIFSFIFGSGWEESGKIASWLSPWMFLVYVGSPLSAMFVVTDKLKLSFLMNFMLLIARLAGLLTGALILKDAEMTIILFSAVSAVYWIIIIIYSMKLAGADLRKAAFFSIAVLTLSLLLLLPFKLYLS